MPAADAAGFVHINKHVIARRAKPDVAIPKSFRKISGIATPVCGLVRNDVFFFRRSKNQRTKEVLRVVDQASPGARMAAWAFSSHLREPPSMEGRLCQGSMQTNLGIPGLDQIRV